ncbi:MAG: hypothetical protein JSV89_04895 [Spirochaetaceae bacterium]|nr:MAG: hypothetical protein JSV89_04895 [Spirochaetaceae bacterium]
MSAKRLLITALLLFLLTATSHGQETEETRRLMVFYEILPGTGLSERETVLIYETLLIELSDASERMAVKEYTGQSIPTSDEEKNRAAEQLEADSWLHVRISGNTDLVTMHIRALDMLSGRVVIEETIEKELLRGIRDLQRQFWQELSTSLADYFASAISRDMNRGTLVFEGIPGTRILGSAWKRTKVDPQGQVSIPVPLPATVPFRATKPGFFPIEGQVYMDQMEKLVVLEQQRGARAAFDVYLNNMSYPGVNFTYFFVPDSIFGRAGILTYLVGLVLDDRDGESESIFTGHSLNNITMSLGFFLNDADRYFRPYFALGATWRFVTAEGYWGLEPIAPFAARPILGFEYARNQKIKLFAEYAPYFYWAPKRNLFELTLPLDRDLAFLFIPKQDDLVEWAWVWEIVVFNVGVRIRI